MVPDYKLIPCDGVYAVWVYLQGEKYRGVMNIGVRPTIDGDAHRLEVHVLDFDADIYGLPVEVAFVERIRSEQKFPNIAALKNQISLDRARALDLLQ
jgi:riboflavin kinase/FMN adenylyltransferase